METTIEKLMEYNIYILLLFMVLTGIICGLTLFLREHKLNIRTFFINIFYAIIATLTVPLFLNLISSELVKTILEGKSIYKPQLLVYIGFCALAALYSKSFLEKMYSKITEDLNKAKEQIAETKYEVESLQDALVEKEGNIDIAIEDINGFNKKEEELFKKILLLMKAIYNSTFKYRTIHSLSKEIGISEDEIITVFGKMKKLKLIITKESKQGSTIFGLSELGVSVFSNKES